MRRPITYIGQSILEWLFTRPAQDNMVALGKLSSAVLGTSTQFSGLAVSPTSPASLQVSVAPGEIYMLSALEGTAYGTLAADTTHQIVKQGISLDATLLSIAAPSVAGQSINYLIQATFQETDISVDPTNGTSPVVLQFYNDSNPTVPYNGPNNTGQTSNTFRQGSVLLSAKAGISATTGSQVTPSPDSGYVGVAVVTIANGQTTITSGNISAYSGAPAINSTLLGNSPVFSVPVQVAAATSANHAMQLGQNGPLGQCALSLSGGNLVLLPRNGNKLTINGVPQTVPSAGVTLAPTGLSATTWYLIYAYMSGGTMTLEASTTAHATDSATGVEVKSGDSTRNLVGGAYVKTAATFTDSATQRFVISWFNRAEKNASNAFAATRTTAAANATPVELGLTTERAEFVTWGDTDARISASGYGNSAGPISTQQNFGVGIDNLNTVDGLWVGLNIPASGGYNLNMSVPGGSYRLTEGYHYCVMMGNSNNSATAGWVGSAIAGQRCSVNVAIKG